MIVGCYTLDLYCDQKNDKHVHGEFPHTFTAEHGSNCRSRAKRKGWILTHAGNAICPKCSGKAPKLVVGHLSDAKPIELKDIKPQS